MPGLEVADLAEQLAIAVEACRPILEIIIDFAAQQQLIPRRMSVDELFDDTTRALTI